LDFIVNWANNPESERTLVLFGQAGTGKSSIAHEIARRFDGMQRLSSSFVFRRGDGPKPQFLFPTLVRDLSDRYPSFKAALGEAIKNNTSLRHTQDYNKVFGSLLRDPLMGLHIVGPILIVIDGLDESRDAMGSHGLHSFLAEHISELPSNFRILITSRPENDIVDVFNRASAVRIIYTSDTELSAHTDDDIYTYLEKKLPQDIFSKFGRQLVKKAECLFQWVAVACDYILKPPAGLTKQRCIRDLLAPSGHSQLNLLDRLYTQVLEAYFTTPAARYQFQSVIGPLLAAVKPLSISSLTALRRFAPADDSDDEESVVAIVSHLGSLLSNVMSSELPIIPLHASFRDFLTDRDRSGDFYIDLDDAHYLLTTSCLGLMLHDSGLRFNICHLESSYLANRDVPGLQSQIDTYIPPALFYACCFWGDHLKHIPFDGKVINKLELFFKEKFLFWLEVLSLVGFMKFAALTLSSVKVWLASDHHRVCIFNISEKSSTNIHYCYRNCRDYGD
jgi:NACHT domain